MGSASALRAAPLLFLLRKPGINADLFDAMEIVYYINMVFPLILRELDNHRAREFCAESATLSSMGLITDDKLAIGIYSGGATAAR
jgi:hypothetical protein